MEKNLVTFESDFHESALEHESDNPDVFASITIDGFPEDENASGQVVAVVYVTRSGDVVTAWHHNGYRMNSDVLALIEQAKTDLIKEYDAARKPRLEITSILTLSTVHVSEKTREMLDEEPETNTMTLSVYQKSDYGWFVYIPDDVAKGLESKDGIPEDLKACVTLAIEHGCSILCLDCDGPELDALAKYED